MALFKISKGSKNNLPTTLTEGYCWYTYEDSMFYIDFKDANGVLTRKVLNAKDAETLGSHSADEFLLEADLDAILAQAKESGEFDGVDGISATHIWNGTTLTVTSASGTSSADLKGEKGDDGASAYEYAQEAGYTGTEAEFAQKLASEPNAEDVGALPLSGGVMTGEIKIGQGDGKGIQLGTNGRINATVGTNTSATMFGVSSGNYYLGHSGFKTLMRGSTTRPTYNNTDLALYSDISTVTNEALAEAKASGEFDGAPGYTPVRGTDYWTDADKAEIKSYVDEAILNGAW